MIIKDSTKAIALGPKRAVESLEIRSLKYYKIQQVVLQQSLSIYYMFESIYNILEGSITLEISYKKKQLSQDIPAHG